MPRKRRYPRGQSQTLEAFEAKIEREKEEALAAEREQVAVRARFQAPEDAGEENVSGLVDAVHDDEEAAFLLAERDRIKAESARIVAAHMDEESTNERLATAHAEQAARKAIRYEEKSTNPELRREVSQFVDGIIDQAMEEVAKVETANQIERDSLMAQTMFRRSATGALENEARHNLQLKMQKEAADVPEQNVQRAKPVPPVRMTRAQMLFQQKRQADERARLVAANSKATATEPGASQMQAGLFGEAQRDGVNVGTQVGPEVHVDPTAEPAPAKSLFSRMMGW